MARAGILLLVAASLSGAGCFAHHVEAKFNRGLGLAQHEVLVIPFSESRRNRWYGESERGHKAAESFKQWAYRNADSPRFAEGEAAKQAVEAVRDWTGEEITPTDWKRLASGLGIKFVLDGDIVSLTDRKPGVIGIYDGAATCRYRVIDVEQGRLAYQATPTVNYGRSQMSEIRITSEFDSQGQVENHLLVLLGERIGEDCYGYDED